MALSINEANTVTDKYYKTSTTQQVYEESALWVKLNKAHKVKRRGGESLQFPIRYLEFDKADAVGPREEVSFEQKETRTGGVLDWKYYIVPQMISWDERAKNTGKPQIVKLMAEKSTEMKQDMQNRFAKDIFTTNPNGLGMISLPVIIDGTADYAGIADADADSNWACAVDDVATTTFLLYGDGSLSESISAATFGTYSPDFHLTTKNLANKAESLLEPQKRYMDKELADAGFKHVTFHGAPIIGDPKCPAAMWLGMCLKAFEIWVHSDYDMELTPWEKLFQAGFPNAMGRTLSWAGNIVCEMRKCNFKYTALDYTL